MRSIRLAIMLLAGLAGTVAAQSPDVITRIALGSCNRENLPQPLWDVMSRHQPQLFIWLGDNIYGDTPDMRVMRAKYAQQMANPAYQRFVATVPVIGTWDDHDYGLNDGGNEFVARDSSQQALLDFLGEPKASPRRRQAGVHAAYTYGPAGRQIKVILLDTRYHRDRIGSNGTVLGQAQWEWLEQELRSSTADINLIVSSIQVIAEDHRFEKWANFPAERQRLFDMIRAARVPGVIMVSGDRHIAELSVLDSSAIGYPLHDLTTSGLTHTWRGTAPVEVNRHRRGELVVALNYGTLDVDWTAADPVITLRVRDERDAVRIEKKIRLSQLRAGR